MLGLGLALGLALASCGGGGGSGDSGAGAGGASRGAAVNPSEWFPLATGFFWRYSGGPVPVELRVDGPRTVAGATAWVVSARELTLSPPAAEESLYRLGTDALKFLATQSADPRTRSLRDFDVLRFPLVPETTWRRYAVTFVRAEDIDRDGIRDDLAIQSQATVVGIQAVVTPAGSFPEAMLVRTVDTQTASLSRGGTVTVTITVDDWYAPGIGLVKSVTTLTNDAGAPSSTIERVLTAYRLGSRRSDTTPPRVSTRSPAPAAVVATGHLRVAFDEAMDTTAPSGLTVIDATGTAVAGSLRWADDRTLLFEPAQALVSGRYTASLSASLTDEFGNPLAPSNWEFVVDATGPVPATFAPAAESRGVALSSPLIQLTFDETVDASSALPGMVELFDEFGAVPANSMIVGRELRVTPANALRRGHRHEVRVAAGLRDLLGNAGAAATWAFYSEEGRFAAPGLLAPGLPGPTEVEAADLDGDGRTDLVAVQTDPADAFFADISWLRQGSGGALLAPVRLPTERACTPDGFAVTDVDADGRLDVFVSSLRCGPQWLRQGADGQFTRQPAISNERIHGPRALRMPADGGRAALLAGTELGLVLYRQTVPGAFSSAVEVAPPGSTGWIAGDVNGDGRDDVLLTGRYGEGSPWVLRVQLQQVDGSLAAPVDIAIGGDFEIFSPLLADVDGDGRKDIVFARGTMTETVGFVRQLAGGAFAAPQWLPVTSASQVAAADVDGDGRVDLLVGQVGVNAMTWLRQSADGGFTIEEVHEHPGFAGLSRGLAVADLSGDRRVDVVWGGKLRLGRGGGASALGAKPTWRPGVSTGGLLPARERETRE